MLFNIFKSMLNDTTDYGIDENVCEFIANIVSGRFEMEAYIDSMDSSVEVHSDYTVRFYDDENNCKLIVEVVEK